MKTIDTLIQDINTMVAEKSLASKDLSEFGLSFRDAYIRQLTPRLKAREGKKLYFSEVGERCMRKLWWKVNGGVEVAPLPAATTIKFLYGDFLENLVLQLAKDAGHTVEEEQAEVKYEVGDGWIVSGRIDAVIDGVVVDVKSTTKFGEQKFADGLADDPFGYYNQLNGYATVLNNDDMGFLTIQKELGHIKWFPFRSNPEAFAECAENAVEVVTGELPARVYEAVPQSKTSKNEKLPTSCSYCDFKEECWKDCNDGQGLRGFAYSGKVEWLTKVVDVPRVAEITNAMDAGEE